MAITLNVFMKYISLYNLYTEIYIYIIYNILYKIYIKESTPGPESLSLPDISFFELYVASKK